MLAEWKKMCSQQDPRLVSMEKIEIGKLFRYNGALFRKISKGVAEINGRKIAFAGTEKVIPS